MHKPLTIEYRQTPLSLVGAAPRRDKTPHHKWNSNSPEIPVKLAKVNRCRRAWISGKAWLIPSQDGAVAGNFCDLNDRVLILWIVVL